MTVTNVVIEPEGIPAAGRIEYSERAAIQDAALAMGTDVVRALVEAITNCADSYGRLEDQGVQGVDGRIDVLVERRRGDLSRIRVRDHAEGMSRELLYERVVQAGRRTGGASSRGFMGRGAKDAAFFGHAVFESIRDGRFSQVRIDRDLNYSDLEPERDATGADYQRLGLPAGQNGTQVSIFVNGRAFSVPRHENLLRRLANHVQLRDILQNPRRQLVLTDVGRPDRKPDVVTFTFPLESTMVSTVDVTLPGYPEATGKLEIRRCERPLEDVRTAERLSGIVIRDGLAVHEATYFGLEGRPGALRFVGTLTCPFIRTLQERFDENPDDPANSIPLVTRTRVGLNRDHPFTRALATFVEDQLRPLVDQEEEQQAQQSGEEFAQTKSRLRQAERELGRRFLEETKRLEAEYREHGGDDTPSSEPVTLRVLPPRKLLQPEESAVFTVHCWPEAWPDGEAPDPPVVRLNIDDAEVAALSATEVLLDRDPREERRLRANFEVTAGLREDATLIEVQLGGMSEVVVVEVAQREEPPTPTPTRLMFSHSSYRVRPGKPKTLVLMAPKSLCETAGSTVGLTSTRNDIAVPESVEMVFRTAEDGRAWFEGELAITLPAGVRGRVRATLSDQVAVCNVSSSEDEQHNPFGFDLLAEDHRYPSEGRARWRFPKGQRRLGIFTQHKSLKPYFGARMEHQETLECRLLIAEVLATEVALLALATADRAGGGALTRDVHAYTSRLNEQLTAYLPIAHRILVPEFAGGA